MSVEHDLSVIKTKSNLAQSNELEYELSLLGVRTLSCENKKLINLKDDIDNTLKKSSSAIFLLNSATIEEIAKENIIIDSCNIKASFVFFESNKKSRERLNISEENYYIAKSRNIEKLAIEIIKYILVDPNKEISFLHSNLASKVWKSPLYIFKKTEEFDTERKILVNVTWSSKPTKPEIADSLQSALRKTIEVVKNDNCDCEILDFGAGKLRHSVFLLQKGFSVTAVDFENIYVRPSPQIQGYLDEVRNSDKFRQVVYPSEFMEYGSQHDLVLLINVLGVMPEPLERLFVLHHCHRNLRDKGYILLFNQHGDRDQIHRASDKITDGGCTKEKGVKTFYKDYNTQEELIRLFALAGFDLSDEADFDSSNNHTLLFRKARRPLFDIQHLIENKRSIIGREVFIGEIDSEVGIADVIDSDKCLKFGDILFCFLELTLKGKSDAYKYEALIKLIIRYIFDKHFKNPIIEDQYEIDQGRKRIDIKVNWRQGSELKDIIITEHGLKSSFVPVECKNYSKPLKNPEYAQIIDRCNKRHRHFGIIICRERVNNKEVLRQCQDRWNNHEYLIIVLDDEDLKTLLKYRDREHQDKIIEFINRKIEEVRDTRE